MEIDPDAISWSQYGKKRINGYYEVQTEIIGRDIIIIYTKEIIFIWGNTWMYQVH